MARFVQDSRAMNKIDIPHFPVVLNPNTFLSQVPPESKWFTVADLSSAFFSISVDPNSQYLFSFTWNNQQYTWTFMSQGLTEAPSYFSQVLHQDLSNLQLPRKSTLLQYTNDVLLSSVTKEASIEDSVYLLQ